MSNPNSSEHFDTLKKPQNVKRNQDRKIQKTLNNANGGNLKETNQSRAIPKMRSDESDMSDSFNPKKYAKVTDSSNQNDIQQKKEFGLLSKPYPTGQQFKLGSLTKPASGNPGSKGSCPKCMQGQCSDHVETQPSTQANPNINPIQVIKEILHDLKDGKAIVKRTDEESLESNGSKGNKDNQSSQKIGTSFSNIEGPNQSMNDSSQGYREAIKIIERFEEVFNQGVNNDFVTVTNQISFDSHRNLDRPSQMRQQKIRKDRNSKLAKKQDKMQISIPDVPLFNEDHLNINAKETWFYFDPRSDSDGNDRYACHNIKEVYPPIPEYNPGLASKDSNDVNFKTPRNEPKQTIGNRIMESGLNGEQRYPGWERDPDGSQNLPRNEQNSRLAIQPTLFCDGLIQLNSQFHLDVSPISRLNVLQRDLYNNSYLNFGQKDQADQFKQQIFPKATQVNENSSDRVQFNSLGSQLKLTTKDMNLESHSDFERRIPNFKSSKEESLDSYVPQIQKFHPRVIQELHGPPNLPKGLYQSNNNFATDVDSHFGQTFSQVCQIFTCESFRVLACVHRIDQNEYLIKACRNKREGIKEAQFYGLLSSLPTSRGLHTYKFSWCENNQVYIAFDSCLGSLKDLFLKEKRRIPLSLLWTVLEDGVRALAFLHANRMAHMDVSPSNFLLTKDGKFKIWNLSHALAVDKCKDFYDYDEGDFRYMSPELRVDIPSDDIESGRLDFFKSDVYSFGLVMTELMLMPQSFENIPDFKSAIPESQLNQFVEGCDVPSELQLIVLKMLRTDPAKRPTAKRLLKLVKRTQNFKRSSLKVC